MSVNYCLPLFSKQMWYKRQFTFNTLPKCEEDSWSANRLMNAKSFTSTYWLEAVITWDNVPSEQKDICSRYFLSTFLWVCLSFCVPAGGVCLHSELSDVHLLGFTLCFLGCRTGQGLRTVRVRLRNTRGKTVINVVCEVFLTYLLFEI